MSNDRKWIFYDSMSKTQSNPITSDEAQMAIFKMKPKDWRRFYVWTTGWIDWQPFELFLKSDQTYFITQLTRHNLNEETIRPQESRQVLEMNRVSGQTHKEITKSYSGVQMDEESSSNHESHSGDKGKAFDVDELSWSDSIKPEIDFKKLKEKMTYGRRNQRHELKIEILLISAKGALFRSNSKNISLSGSLLEDNIPFDYYGITFEVVIVNRGSKNPHLGRVSLKAQTVGEGLTQRLTFSDVTKVQKKALKSLLQDYLDQQQKSYSKIS